LRKRRMFFRVFAASRQKLDKPSHAQPMSRRQESRGYRQELGRRDRGTSGRSSGSLYTARRGCIGP
jgi:hypothetical protein